jgi:transposase
MNRSSRQARREQVLYHLVKGTPEAQIAELLGVHRYTVARDVAYIRNEARGWLDDLAKDGFIHEYHMALEKIRDHEYELQQLLSKADGNVEQKIQILRALDENVKLYLELLGETPAVHAYKRAVGRLQEQSGGKR